VIDRRVLFFGDSLVAGVGDPEGRGWVGRVVAASFEAEVPLSAYNLGVRRQTSVEIAARWQAEAAPRLSAEADCSVVFSCGANDTTIEDRRLRVKPESSLDSLGAALDQAARLNLRALVVGPAPVEDKQQTDRISALSDGFAELCDGRDTAFVDVVSELRDSDVWQAQIKTGDGAHPGAQGYELLAGIVLRSGWIEWCCSSRPPDNDWEVSSD
jgi:lysophospholipase L1-like esterase